MQRILKPFTRFFLGFIAVPIFRIVMRKVVRVQEINEELEKDLEQWFRGSLLLLVATYNMEGALFSWVPKIDTDSKMSSDWKIDSDSQDVVRNPYLMAGRLLLAIGVIEGMPDQSLFALIHPGPQKPTIEKGRLLLSLIRYLPQLLKGLICQHLNRSSPVLAILSVLHTGTFGWVCYGIAISQYLFIGLVTSKDKALDVLSQFDAAVAIQRTEIEARLHLNEAAKNTAESHLETMDPHVESM
jgi:hypothetical protein